jgi:hypothetical protein
VTTGSPALFRFALSQGPNVLVQCTAINNRFSHDVRAKDVRHVSHRFADMRHALKASYRIPKFCKIREPTGSDCRQMLNKIRSLYFTVQEVGGGCGDWMELAQDRDRWRATCEYGEELLGSKNAGNFLTSCRTS